MMTGRSFIPVLALFVLMLMSAAPARAACTSPSGPAGKIIYSSAQKTFQYCRDSNWVAMNLKPGTGSGGCTSPTLAEGRMIYNADQRVLQGCAGNVHRPFGTVGGGAGWKQVSSGDYHACGIKFDSTLWCWGLNNVGQHGDNTSANEHNTPNAVTGGHTWKQVTTGEYFTCAIKSDDTLYCWGDNAWGQSGDNSTIDHLVPEIVTGGYTWKMVAAGSNHVCGIRSDDALYCWGLNTNGQLGDNSITQRNIPTAVNGGGSWKYIAAGYYHTCGIRSDDTMRCWGNNDYGRLGDNTVTQRNIPTALSGGGTWKKVEGGLYHTCGIKADDTLHCWGWNVSGQLGDNTLTQRNIPTAISGGGSWKEVAAGYDFSCGIKSDNTARCWGNQDSGQLGDGTLTRRLVPTALVSGGTYKQIVTGQSYSCGLTLNGAIRCWGNNVQSEMGDNSSLQRVIPTAIKGGGTWKKISNGYLFSCGIKTDDTLWCWGNNDYGQIGDNTNTMAIIPTAINGAGSWKAVTTGGSNTGTGHGCGIKSDDTVRCWGNNTNGQLGDNTTGQKLIPTAVNGAGSWKQISAGGKHTCGIRSDDTARCWGLNGNGQLGDNSTTQRLIPTTLNGGGTWKQLATGDFHSCGIKLDNTLWCWGLNTNGRLGDNSTTQRLVPTTVNGGGTWKMVAVGASHTCAIKSDDTLWCWGLNGNGQLGDNSTTQRLVPTAISGSTTWLQIATGEQFTCGVKMDNTLLCWGLNSFGQLGDNSTTQRLVPTVVSGSGAWKFVATSSANSTPAGYHTCAISYTDYIYCWGHNNSSQLTATEFSYLYNLTGVNTSCTSPIGKSGKVIYNDSIPTLQYCDGAGWVGIGTPGIQAGCDMAPDAFGFTDQIELSPTTQYLSNIIGFSGLGPKCPTNVSISGSGSPEYRVCLTSDCSYINVNWTSSSSTVALSGKYLQLRATTPAGAGAMNTITATVGGVSDNWDISTSCASGGIGTVCADGTVYAGNSAGVDFYVPRCDYNQSWSGSACTGSRTTRTWNDGSTGYVNTALIDCVAAGSCADTGESSTNTLYFADASTTAGTQNHIAARYCQDLAIDGNNDWYLPSVPELNIMYTNRVAIGNFDTSVTGVYWSSAENNLNNAWRQSFNTGTQNTTTKNTAHYVRCARRN